METINTVCFILKSLLFDLSYKWYSLPLFDWSEKQLMNAPFSITTLNDSATAFILYRLIIK